MAGIIEICLPELWKNVAPEACLSFCATYFHNPQQGTDIQMCLITAVTLLFVCCVVFRSLAFLTADGKIEQKCSYLLTN
jgi:hypothetical protein